MKFKLSIILALTYFCSINVKAEKLDSIMPVRGFFVHLSFPVDLPKFLSFIEKDLVPAEINTLILGVNWGFDYQKYPELRDSGAFTLEDIKQIVQVCKKYRINIVPQINLLGHQSWEEKTWSLLREYPHLDETPGIKMPEKFEFPNKDGLYCKSYCPNHPDVHEIVFSCVDELMDAFEAKDFHAGLDEVFYIAHSNCTRCSGKDPAQIFAAEINRIAGHLKKKNRRLWMWGDRLIDAETTGISIWEASKSNTYNAIDLIDKSVLICDWHYDRADPTAVYFAMKGFDVAVCNWINPKVTEQQLSGIRYFKENSPKIMSNRFVGYIQTCWYGFDSFISTYQNNEIRSEGASFRTYKNFVVNLSRE